MGHAAWISLVLLRLIQGLAVGGEYGGAVVYVAEHSRPDRRGLLTGWIQIASSVGLALHRGHHRDAERHERDRFQGLGDSALPIG
ncbi:MFS transporter [Bradyrhizobium barranii]|uniref:MFS transporter n=1 Tax=Bradyrhizobium TaxID=374 RepID=UPI003133C0E9